MNHLQKSFADSLGLYTNKPQARWFAVEISIGGRTEVVEAHALNRHGAYHMVINGLSRQDLDRAADGVTLRILPN